MTCDLSMMLRSHRKTNTAGAVRSSACHVKCKEYTRTPFARGHARERDKCLNSTGPSFRYLSILYLHGCFFCLFEKHSTENAPRPLPVYHSRQPLKAAAHRASMALLTSPSASRSTCAARSSETPIASTS